MKKSLQEKYEEFQLLDQTIKQLQQHHSMLHSQLVELRKIEQSVLEIGALKKENGLLVPLGAGVFVKATLKATDEMIVNVGASTLVKKTKEETLVAVRKQINELDEFFGQVEAELTEKITEATQLHEALQES